MSAHDTDTRGILLIGDISRVFLDTGAVRELPCEVRTSIPDAIEAAAKNSFRAICIVMSGMSAKLSSSLKALREVNSEVKIILLAQMCEEPVAIQLVGLVSNGTNVADDYLICPIRFSHLVSRISYLAGAARDVPVHAETAAPATVDAAMEMKIKQLEKLATEDDLTGLKNRRYIWEFSRQIIKRAEKDNGRVTLLVFDVDNLKHYNDIYGHSAGDKILKQAAVLMRRCCRGHDVVGRIGGDEFAVVFWDEPQRKPVGLETERRSATADHPKEAIFVAERFRGELERAELHLLGPEGKGLLTISGGLASFPRDASTVQELFQQADRALLEAKRSGKNRIYLVGKPQNDIADVE
ncbi:MAG: GGDEF domain-containing protein [Planctomycetota bacterium]|jgi:diguanylate cyclase (GGDEF)-like protein